MKILYCMVVASLGGALAVIVNFDASAAENRASSGIIMTKPQVHHQRPGQTPTISVKVNYTPMKSAINHSAISGTSMKRPGLTTGTIGGPVKFRAGVINGTDTRSKHF
jgi:hypothetical protein